MPLCKFYMQGNCHFGNNCKNEHSVDVRSYLSNTTNKPSQAITPIQQNVDVQTLVKSVVNDMIAAEKGGQWLLSCYAPFKEKAAYPGFIELSFEEARFDYYQAIKNGNLENFKQDFQKMLQTAIGQIRSLQNPNSTATNLLKAIYYNQPLPTNNSFQQQQSIFGQPNYHQQQQQQQQQQIFSQQTAPNQSIFTNEKSNQSILVNQPSVEQQLIFSNHSNQSIYGNTSTQINQSQNQNTQQIIPSVGQSIFGNNSNQYNNNYYNQQQISTTVKKQPTTTENVYSEIKMLSKEEIDWFKSNDLNGNIPLNPPTKDMC